MKFKLNLEVLPLWATCVCFLAFFVLIIPSNLLKIKKIVLIVGYYVPEPYTVKSQALPPITEEQWKDFLVIYNKHLT
jgi:hypothetical protein